MRLRENSLRRAIYNWRGFLEEERGKSEVHAEGYDRVYGDKILVKYFGVWVIFRLYWKSNFGRKTIIRKLRSSQRRQETF